MFATLIAVRLHSFERVHTKPSVVTNPRTRLPRPLGQSLLTERDNRVNPGGSQRWEEAREYGNRNQEQRCSR